MRITYQGKLLAILGSFPEDIVEQESAAALQIKLKEDMGQIQRRAL